MLTSLALVFFVGLALAALCQKLKLPRIIGMLATGILLGPCVLNVLDGSILSISADLRKLALVIILLKAGLSLDLGDLKKVGRPAILMSCLPATCEIIGYVPLFSSRYPYGALPPRNRPSSTIWPRAVLVRIEVFWLSPSACQKRM